MLKRSHLEVRGSMENKILSMIVLSSVTWSCSTAKFSGKTPERGQDSPVTTATPPAPPVDQAEKPTPEVKKPEEGGIGVGETEVAELPKPVQPAPGGEAPPVVAPPQEPKPPTEPAPGTGIATVPKEVPKCTPTEKRTGTKMVIVVDNSNSNAETDCPGAIKTGEFNGSSLYKCTLETNREKAALAVYDLLKGVAESDAANPLAKSQLAVTSFPTQADYVSGSKIEKSFMDTTQDKRSEFQTSLQFTRSPYGMTPYGSAMASLEQVFKSTPDDQRSKVALFVTDGEATDRNPGLAAAQAEALMAGGIEIFTVYYPAKDSRLARAEKHRVMMKGIDDQYFATSGQHWYDENKFSDFTAYIDSIVGRATGGGDPEPSTLLKISSKVDRACADGVTLCDRKSYEVVDAQGLTQALQQIVKREVIGCEL